MKNFTTAVLMGFFGAALPAFGGASAPTPEPSSKVLLGVLVAGVLGFAWFKARNRVG